jgi:hypothetical protein
VIFAPYDPGTAGERKMAMKREIGSATHTDLNREFDAWRMEVFLRRADRIHVDQFAQLAKLGLRGDRSILCCQKETACSPAANKRFSDIRAS